MKEKDKSFNLPKNIKQMGSIDEDFKIYMEDYVFTYLQQYSKDSRGEERVAILVGDSYNIDGNEVLFINGAIKGEHTIHEDGILKFSKKSFEYIDEQINKYFLGSKIIGWFYSQPGFSDYINEGYINYHKEVFKEENQVFFLSDPTENIGGFYRFFNNTFQNVKGFIIYYEKNESMSEYMLANKSIDIKSEEERYKAKDERLKDITRNSKACRVNGKAIQDQRKMFNIFGSLSAVLLIVCFIMGAGLIQSDDRISELERRIAKLDESYRYVLSQMKNDNVKSVFADDSSDSKKLDTKETTIETVTEITTEIITEANTTIEKNITVDDKNKKLQNIDTYEIKEGDSLEGISKKIYGTRNKISDIMEVNNMDDPNKIYSGMVIKLP